MKWVEAVACAAAGIAQQQGEPRFHAPKAQLLKLILEGWFGDSPVVATLGLVTIAALVYGIPIFLAWDFAKGERRRVWVWVVFAAIGSWLVLPVIWIATSRSRDGAPNEPGTDS